MADSDDGSSDAGSTLTITPGDRDAIIRTVLGEAGNQGDLGQAAVAHVIMNRAIGSGASPTAVVLAPNQFEANANGLKPYAPGSAAYQGAAKVVDGVLGGDIPDPTNGADHFLNPDTVMARYGRLPGWARGDGVQIGAHVFLGGRGQPAAAASAPDASSAIASAVQPSGQPAQPGMGAVPPGMLAFAPDGLTHAVDQQPGSPAAGAAPGAQAPSDAQLEGMLTGKAPAAPAAPAMSDDALETLLTGKPPAAAAPQTPGVSFAPTQPANPAGMSDADLEHFLTSGQPAPGAPAAPAPGAPQPALTPAQLASGRDPQTGELVVGGKPFTSDAGHWNGFVNAANGALQGAGTDVMAAAAALKAKLADNDPKSLRDLFDQAKSTYQGGRQAYASSNPLLAGLTEVGGSLATAVPAMAAGGSGLAATGNALVDAARGIPVVSRAVPAAEAAGRFLAGSAGAGGSGMLNPLLRGASLATRGAATGAAGAALSSGLSDDPLADQVRRGAEIGGVVGTAGPAALNVARSGVNKLLGAGSVSPETAQLAQLAQSYGVPLRAGQVAESPGVKFADSTLATMPGMGYGADAARQATAFNRAVAGTFGETADKITPTVMAAAKQRIGAALDGVAGQTTIQQDAPFVQDLTHLANDAHGVLADSELRPLRQQMQNVLSKFDGNGEMGGDAYQALTRRGAPLDRLMNSSDSNLRFYAGKVRDALDDAMERSASPQILDQLQQARSQYRNMMTIAPLVEKSATGDVSPVALMQAVRGNSSNMAFGGGGQLGDLARIGQKFLKEPPQSGTAPREAVGNALAKVGAMGAAAFGLEKASPYVSPEMVIPSLASAAGTYVAGRAASSVLRSPAVANMLVQRALGQAPAANPLLSGVASGAPMLAGPVVNRLLLPSPQRAATP